jgi:hypothetical protein
LVPVSRGAGEPVKGAIEDSKGLAQKQAQSAVGESVCQRGFQKPNPKNDEGWKFR